MTTWHAPGMGEIHSDDESIELDCLRFSETFDQFIADDELAAQICETLNTHEKTLARLNFVLKYKKPNEWDGTFSYTKLNVSFATQEEAIDAAIAAKLEPCWD